MFDAIRYFRDRRIDFATSGENIGPGWVGLDCPFCRDTKKHLGFNLEHGILSCWRCGSHSAEGLVMALEGLKYHEACKVVLEYSDDQPYRIMPKPRTKAQGLEGKLRWPDGTVPLQPYHKSYLAARGYDPDHLVRKYGLMGTLGAGSYALRIMAPIFHDGIWVSYQGRDITGNSKLRYKACREELELVSHKTILYNLDNCQGSTAMLVEGITDVWRMGDGSCASFGITTSKHQVRLLSERFGKVYVMFDREPEAQKAAKSIANQLSVLGVEATVIRLREGDPADMSQGEAERVRLELIGA